MLFMMIAYLLDDAFPQQPALPIHYSSLLLWCLSRCRSVWEKLLFAVENCHSGGIFAVCSSASLLFDPGFAAAAECKKPCNDDDDDDPPGRRRAGIR
ncbi:hypothetical protein Y032_0010g912 [Ancylostoma ceylanicum]|uniref:Uncharacterized protein n=1 Tax=Ancylostoma ceylanicum TaxID=53326 RepID=A0A016VHC7_9BILA|nr:hypothetical protein Y032_0010g912 [Ancylostoma ceylanicum]